MPHAGVTAVMHVVELETDVDDVRLFCSAIDAGPPGPRRALIVIRMRRAAFAGIELAPGPPSAGEQVSGGCRNSRGLEGSPAAAGAFPFRRKAQATALRSRGWSQAHRRRPGTQI